MTGGGVRSGGLAAQRIATHQAEDPMQRNTTSILAALAATTLATLGGGDGSLDQAIGSRARFVFLVPCCYADAMPFAARAKAVIAGMTFVADDLIRQRMRSSLIDMERKLRLEAAGYETEL